MQIWRGKLISRKISDRKIVTFLHCVYHWENSMSCHLKKVAEKNFFELFFDKTFFFNFQVRQEFFCPFGDFTKKVILTPEENLVSLLEDIRKYRLWQKLCYNQDFTWNQFWLISEGQKLPFVPCWKIWKWQKFS